MLSGKNVLLAVTGSIAAYKTTFLTRLLVKQGASVKVVLTPSAKDFVTPLTLATLSKNPVYWEYFDEKSETGEWNNHVELGLWADLLLVAPATSNTLAKMVTGVADNFLLGVYLSAKCPVFFAPAMDLDMYKHPATKSNILTLKERGNICIPAESGELASGLEGEGRMAEPENIISFLENHLLEQAPLKGKRVLINGGPTYEALDPVRFIGNHSSGKMGYALAKAALELGAEVHLVLGPNALTIKENPRLRIERVTSAIEMLEACEKHFSVCDIAILSAAISDYRPETKATQKIKKKQPDLTLKLVKNPDVLFNLGKKKTKNQLLVGFALETENGEVNATEKLHKKNCDFIVLNTPNKKGTGFGHDTNEVSLIGKNTASKTLTLKDKDSIAHEIFEHIL